MDFESYIGKERQLLSRIERERAEMNSHEPDAWRGNYQLAADEIKLLRAGDYVRDTSGMAADAIVALDERMTKLKQIEAEASAKNDMFLKRVDAWETKFDQRYAEIMAAMAREMAAMEAKNVQLTRRIETAEGNMQEISRKAESALQDISSKSEKSLKESAGRTEQTIRQASERAESSMKEMSEITEASLKDLSKATYADVDKLVGSLKAAQAEFEASINEKLEQDKQTLEKIRFMISTMSDIIKT
jgi:DNA anti-recombination protein RmuC